MRVFINEGWKTIFCSQRNMSCRQWMLIKSKQIFVSKSVSRTHEIVLRNKKVFSQKKSQSFASWPGWLASCLLSCEQSRSDLIDATFYAFPSLPSQCWWWQLYVGTELVDEFELSPCCSTNDQTSPLSTFGSPLVAETQFQKIINHKSNIFFHIIFWSWFKLLCSPNQHHLYHHDHHKMPAKWVFLRELLVCKVITASAPLPLLKCLQHLHHHHNPHDFQTYFNCQHHILSGLMICNGMITR